jgi:hypothetical protein
MKWMAPFPALLALLLSLQSADGFAFDETDEDLVFHYGWPVEVDTTPVLRRRLDRELSANYAEAQAAAEADRARKRGLGLEFGQHDFAKDWRTEGVTPQLLSLAATTSSYSGGAHPNVGFSTLLWDRANDRPVAVAQMIGRRGLAQLEPRYCAAFRAERAEAIGEPVDAELHCPPLAARTLAPADQDGDGRFETLVVLLDAYEAGGYAGGPAVVEIGFQAGDLPLIARRYRAAFEAAD